MQVRKQQLELDVEQQIGSKLGKEYVKAVYLTYMQSDGFAESCLTLHDPMDCSIPGFPVPHHLLEFFPSMQSTSCEMPGLMNPKLESRSLGEISTTSNVQMIPP